MNIKEIKNIIKKIIALDWSYTSKAYLELLAKDPDLKSAHDILKVTNKFSTGEDLKQRLKALTVLRSRGIRYCD